MGQTNSKPSSPPPASPGRLYHLDNLRTFLTALVIFHHTSIPFGGLGSWAYISPHHVQGSSLTLTAFNALNQSFFMGSFFYLSGIMSSQSLKRRKSVRTFLRTKWSKLGVPVVVYTVLGPPAQLALIRFIRGQNAEFLATLAGHVKELRSVRGPVWYSSLLLLFDTAYSLLPPLSLPGIGFWPLMALNIGSSFLLQVPSPLNEVFKPLSVRPGYFPQYLIAYILGTRSGPNDASLLTPGRRSALLAASILSGFCILGLLKLSPERYSLSSLNRSFNLLAFSYAVWNETTGFLLGASLLNLFERKEWGRRKWENVGRYSYAAFLVHPVICVGLQVAFEGWKAGGMAKTLVCGSLGVVGSWATAWGLVKVPWVGKVF
jgi:fucose 4-O-acetylase-like acetyltransferase